MKVKSVIEIIQKENPNANIMLEMFGGISGKETNAVPVNEALNVFEGWLDEEVRTIYNGTYYSTFDRSSPYTYYTSPDLVVLVYWANKEYYSH